ncbi:hypothetical protein OTU49_001921 [Cherax quadricarinatus]|uniref:Beta-1,4-N-acetylgalactosaminyltransferase bre-4 n=2 Tax=Cherax quadricarinatus TaxID=27406 RepID=A0AAW0XHQ2_CHEQU
MYPSGDEGGLGRYQSGACCMVRDSMCRPRFWKFLLLVVVLLMMAQFSLNILFYRNYDSLFYVNATSAEVLPSFESRVKWVRSKLPWVSGITENQVIVDQSQYLHISSNNRPVTLELEISNNTSSVDKNLKKFVGEEIINTVNSAVPSSETIQDKVRGKNSQLSSLPLSKLLLTDSREEDSKGTIAKSNMTLRAVSDNLLKASSGMHNNSDKKKNAIESKIPHLDAYTKSFTNESGSENDQENRKVLLSKEKPPCPPVPPKLVGSVKIHRTSPTLEEQERNHPELEPGGRFRPADCRARHRVAIIIPYRDRIQHLAVFLFHMHPILQRQQIDYAIYLVEQAGTGKFNRAMLMNVGALEALKQYQYDCFIFHDVDLIPEDDRNLYTCPEQPRHMSIAIDSMKYRLPYNDIFGGVSAMTVEQFRKVNGFSNKFWGWGGEDDDMSNRIKYHGFFISRYPANIGRYTMLSHKKDVPNPRRYQYLYEGKKRFKTDGLTSAKYRALDVQLRRLYTWVYVDLYPS